MKPNARPAATITLIIFAIAFPALAFEYPLSSTSIREAYFQGAHADAKLDEFLQRYTANPPMPKTGQFHISMIRMQTPYEQVVERVMQNFNYDEQSAQRDFTEKPVAFRVRVEIHTTPSYKGRPYDGVGAYLVSRAIHGPSSSSNFCSRRKFRERMRAVRRSAWAVRTVAFFLAGTWILLTTLTKSNLRRRSSK